MSAEDATVQLPKQFNDADKAVFDGNKGYQYVGDPFVLFQNFFGSMSPFVEATGGSDFGLAERGYQKGKEPALEMDLECTLNELFLKSSAMPRT